MYPRIFISHHFYLGLNITLTEHFHHVIHVLRKGVGDCLCCVDLDGSIWDARIVDIENDSYSIEVISLKLQDSKDASYSIAFGNIRPHRAAMLVEKCTEIGIDNFYPLITDYVQVRHCNCARLERVGLSAAQQSQRSRLPKVYEMQKLEELPLNEEWVVAVPGASDYLGSGNRKIVGALIGPEGGFSYKEVEWCVSRGVRTVNLGRRILRAETACIVAATLLVSKEV